MAERIPWNKYEIALLIEACEKVINNKKDKPLIVTELSIKLRNMALANGIVIDELFRNENGITLQMAKMTYLLTNGKDGLSGASSSFVTYANMRKNHPREIEQILNEIQNQKSSEVDSSEPIIKKYVDKSFLNAGLTIPKSASQKVIEDLKLSLNKGENCKLTIKIENNFYDATLTNIAFSQKYAEVDMLQIRYSAKSPICVKLNEIFSASASKISNGESLAKEEFVNIYVVDTCTLEFKCFPLEKTEKKELIIINKDRKDGFSEWLEEKPNNKFTIDNILSVLSECSDYAVKHGVSKYSFWEVKSVKEFDKICGKLLSMRLFRIMHRKAAIMLDKVRGIYKSYLINEVNPPQKAMNEKVDTVSAEHSTSNETNLINYDYQASTSLSYTKPELVMYFGEIDTNIQSWREAYISIINSLYEDYPYIIKRLAEDSNCTYISCIANLLRVPIPMKDGMFVEGNRSANELVRNIKHLLELCNVDFENIVIRYSKTAQDEFQTTEDNQITSNKLNTCNEVILTEVDRRLYEIIEKRYVTGFLVGAINFKKIKRFYEEDYCQELNLESQLIEESLKKTCLKVNNKYYASSVLMEYSLKVKFKSYVDEALLNKGYVYYDNLFNRFGYELTERIPDVELLKKFLEKEFPQYTILDTYIARDSNVTIDATREVEKILFDAASPLSVERIKQLLPHLTDDAVQKVIWNDEKIITTNNNDRFLIDSMVLTNEDLQEIEKIINEALSKNNCMFGTELLQNIQNRLPLLYDSIIEFGDRGVRGAIAYKLKNKFKFNANIICKIDANIDNSEVFRSYAQTERYFTLLSLENLREQIGVSGIYFEAVNEVASRINDNDYVPNESLQFNISGIDSVLNQIIIGNMCSLKQACNFAIFPSAYYPWTEYLLETYVAKYSSEFKLCHSGYAERKCCGAIVKKSSPINSMDDVIIEYLISNKSVQSTQDALENLVEDGFIARKRYKNIEDLLIVAKAKRKD